MKLIISDKEKLFNKKNIFIGSYVSKIIYYLIKNYSRFYFTLSLG